MQGSRRPTIKEVAKKACVGVMTVSRVINHHPSVRPATRKKVEAAIAQLGYRQNEAARQLKGQRGRTIGLILPDLSDLFFASFAHTVQQIAREHGYMILVASSERDEELEIREAELMASRMISGLLLATSCRERDERLASLSESGIALVAFDRPLPGIDVSSVLVENRTGAEDAIQHLIRHGHKRIVCVGYDESVYTIRERIQGYLYTMYAAGLQPSVVNGLSSLDSVRQWISDIRNSADCPTAIFSLNHRTSSHLLQGLAEKKIRIPDEMALIGFDDFDLASVMQPPLTTVAQSPVELARRSMDQLLEQMSNKNTASPRPSSKLLLPAKLMVRASCGAHKG